MAYQTLAMTTWGQEWNVFQNNTGMASTEVIHFWDQNKLYVYDFLCYPQKPLSITGMQNGIRITCYEIK